MACISAFEHGTDVVNAISYAFGFAEGAIGFGACFCLVVTDLVIIASLYNFPFVFDALLDRAVIAAALRLRFCAHSFDALWRLVAVFIYDNGAFFSFVAD